MVNNHNTIRQENILYSKLKGKFPLEFYMHFNKNGQQDVSKLISNLKRLNHRFTSSKKIQKSVAPYSPLQQKPIKPLHLNIALKLPSQDPSNQGIISTTKTSISNLTLSIKDRKEAIMNHCQKVASAEYTTDCKASVSYLSTYLKMDSKDQILEAYIKKVLSEYYQKIKETAATPNLCNLTPNNQKKSKPELYIDLNID
ncbi:MAG: hypothetical protein K0S74_86 [Chlamydiales bacterium]|jgi:hypothetical protein|nr:hypothetical protein [Chlamydiales bacterium]